MREKRFLSSCMNGRFRCSCQQENNQQSNAQSSSFAASGWQAVGSLWVNFNSECWELAFQLEDVPSDSGAAPPL